MAKAHHDARPQSVQVEAWEIEVARSVARSFKTFPEHEDLEAELLKRLLELKSRGDTHAREWRAFLARSLYNAAIDVVRRRNWWRDKLLPLDTPLGGEREEPLTLEGVLAAPEEDADLRIDMERAWESLSPEMRQLWGLLVEERGNMASVARQMGRSERTVRFWAAKLRVLLKELGIDG